MDVLRIAVLLDKMVEVQNIVRELKQVVEELEESVEELNQGVGELKADVGEIKQNVAKPKIEVKRKAQAPTKQHASRADSKSSASSSSDSVVPHVRQGRRSRKRSVYESTSSSTSPTSPPSSVSSTPPPREEAEVVFLHNKVAVSADRVPQSARDAVARLRGIVSDDIKIGKEYCRFSKFKRIASNFLDGDEFACDRCIKQGRACGFMGDDGKLYIRSWGEDEMQWAREPET